SLILKPSIQEASVGHRYSCIPLAMLDQGRRLGLLDVGNWGNASIDFGVLPGRGSQHLAGKRWVVARAIVEGPIGRAGFDDGGLKPVARRGDVCSQRASIAVTCDSQPRGVDVALMNKRFHASDDIGRLRKTQSPNDGRPKSFAVPPRTAIVWPQDN